MGRRTREVKIPGVRSEQPGARDNGKTFYLTEMPASQGERWGIRALALLIRSGVELPDEVAEGGLQAVAALGWRMFGALAFDDIEPLLEEMFACVQIKEPAIIRDLTESDIEEIMTRVRLRSEVWKLHTDFFELDALRAQILGRMSTRD